VTHSTSRRTPRAAALLSLGLATLAGCHDLPERRGATVVEGIAPTGALEEKNPVDVVVPPVIDESGNPALPANALRSAFQRGLVKRRYSPLASEYIDMALVDGSYRPGTLEEDAVLAVIIEGWDTEHTESHGRIGVRAEVRLIDAATLSVLWSGRVDRKFEFGSLRGLTATRERFTNEACDQIAGEILAALPTRAPQP
jgi:hypothetical protein